MYRKAILERYAKEHHFTDLIFFVDDGYSGTNLDRPGSQKMLEAAENDRAAVVIEKDLSRFGRNSALTGMYINFVFTQHGERVGIIPIYELIQEEMA